jgi:hypothetical protein
MSMVAGSIFNFSSQKILFTLLKLLTVSSPACFTSHSLATIIAVVALALQSILNLAWISA